MGGNFLNLLQDEGGPRKGGGGGGVGGGVPLEKGGYNPGGNYAV